jgi:hypothetical protein
VSKRRQVLFGVKAGLSERTCGLLELSYTIGILEEDDVITVVLKLLNC